MDDKMFTELLGSVKEMDQIARGKKKPARTTHFPEPEIKAIREKTGLSQSNFALLIGVSKRTLENWEQGRRHPTGPAKVLLRLLNDDPQHAIETLHQ